MAQRQSRRSQRSALDVASPRRPITSCLECYRRKQKCNRLQPCDQCYSRKVPEKCCYSGGAAVASTPSAYGDLPTPLEIGENDADHADSMPTPSSLASQAGYSTSPGSSSFPRLRNGLSQSSVAQSSASSTAHQRLQSSYMKTVAQFPPPDVVDALLNYFFRNVYWTFMAIEEHWLQNMFDQWRTTPVEDYIRAGPNSPQRELLHFPALLFQVLAQILHNISPHHPAAEGLKLNDYDDCDRLSRVYHLLGSSIMNRLGRRYPTLCSIEHDVISGVWLKDSSRGVEAWFKLGDAVRQAQELGLHRLPESVEQKSDDSLESNLLSAWDLEHKKRIWTRLFTLDSIMALLLGRPRYINREDFTTPAPLNVEYPIDPSRTLPLPSNDSPLLSMMIFVSLAHKAHDILSFTATGAFLQDYSKVLAIHDEICSLRYKLPLLPRDDHSDTASNIATLRITILRFSLLNSINVVLMALHRPLIVDHPVSRKAAVSAALEGLDTQHSILDLIPPPQARFYANVFSTIESCIFLCGIMVELPPHDPIEDRRIRQAILQGTERLSALKDRSGLAKSGEKILRQFYQEIQTVREPVFEKADGFQTHPRQSSVATEDTRLRDVTIPSPQRSYNAFQSLIGNGQASAVQTDIFSDPEWDAEEPYTGDIGELFNYSV